MIAKIAVSAANFAIDKPYSYFVPQGPTVSRASGSRCLSDAPTSARKALF